VGDNSNTMKQGRILHCPARLTEFFLEAVHCDQRQLRARVRNSPPTRPTELSVRII
jgi:hypothetical protein